MCAQNTSCTRKGSGNQLVGNLDSQQPSEQRVAAPGTWISREHCRGKCLPPEALETSQEAPQSRVPGCVRELESLSSTFQHECIGAHGLLLERDWAVNVSVSKFL